MSPASARHAGKEVCCNPFGAATDHGLLLCKGLTGQRGQNSCAFDALVALLLCTSWGAQAERYTVPLLLPAKTTTDAPQGVLRMPLNGTAESGTVSIHAIDDAGARSGPATFTLNGSAAVEFTAMDLRTSDGWGRRHRHARLHNHAQRRH